MTIEYKIEKGVPVSPAIRGRPSVVQDFLAELSVGDSFVVPYEDRNNFRQPASSVGIKITIRSDGNGSARIWRVE